MPIAIVFFLYVLAETLTFWALSTWIGLGWTLVLLFGFMLFGMTIAGLEVRRIMAAKVQRFNGATIVRDDTPGKTAGNVGLTLLGGMLLTLPGFVTTALGLLLIMPPTRSILRTILTVKLFQSMENLGARIYRESPLARQHDIYGSFADPYADSAPFSASSTTEIIEEDEIRTWSKSINPEDFSARDKDSNDEK
ncbi:MAG: FxsA family protein [Corynebacterium sp.]|nr:FxsA family protein [Corynebacterium sp.]